MTRQALENYSVLDFSQAWAAPIASMMMADLGAEVVKVESPKIGDQVRAWTRADLNGLSPYYLAANRNKRSIVIDLKTEEGRKLALDLSSKVDVVLENFRPGTMDRLGLAYEDVLKVNPDVVYCSVSGYGASGPLANRAAYDLLIQGEAGVLSVTGTERGEIVKPGVPFADVMSATVAAYTILAALLSRQHTGKGQKLDISMLEVTSMTMAYLMVDYQLSGKKAKPLGSANQLLAPYEVYHTSTSPIVIGVLSEVHWRSFCDAIGLPELFADKRFSYAYLRVANREALNEIIIPVLKQLPAEQWVSIFEEAGIACGNVKDVETLLTHPQHKERKFFETIEVDGRTVTLPGRPWNIEPRTAPTRPPHHGEHTREVLGDWLKIEKSEIERLLKAGVIS